MRSIQENIWTVVFKYVPNEVRSVRKTKVQIFSCMDRINCWIRALLYNHIKLDQKSKPALNLELNIFMSCLNVAVGREILPSLLSHLK